MQLWSIPRKTKLTLFKLHSAEFHIHDKFSKTFHLLHMTSVHATVENININSTYAHWKVMAVIWDSGLGCPMPCSSPLFSFTNWSLDLQSLLQRRGKRNEKVEIVCRYSLFIFQIPQAIKDSGASEDKQLGQGGRKTWLFYQKEGPLCSDFAIPEVSDKMEPDRKDSWLPPRTGDNRWPRLGQKMGLEATPCTFKGKCTSYLLFICLLNYLYL